MSPVNDDIEKNPTPTHSSMNPECNTLYSIKDYMDTKREFMGSKFSI